MKRQYVDLVPLFLTLAVLLVALGCEMLPQERSYKVNAKDLIEVCTWRGGQKVCTLVDRKDLENELRNFTIINNRS